MVSWLDSTTTKVLRVAAVGSRRSETVHIGFFSSEKSPLQKPYTITIFACLPPKFVSWKPQLPNSTAITNHHSCVVSKPTSFFYRSSGKPSTTGMVSYQSPPPEHRCTNASSLFETLRPLTTFCIEPSYAHNFLGLFEKGEISVFSLYHLKYA
ncbi:unnamed protein product [Lactuca virosa]|uniref:Uncharacterized protein n=1 Tax=Lactuca virosa TaxID=75947 RepID=A0AAU9MWA9_9ASTR|nr:unnamed protein product [Lactuca virosa]